MIRRELPDTIVRRFGKITDIRNRAKSATKGRWTTTPGRTMNEAPTARHGADGPRVEPDRGVGYPREAAGATWGNEQRAFIPTTRSAQGTQLLRRHAEVVPDHRHGILGWSGIEPFALRYGPKLLPSAPPWQPSRSMLDAVAPLLLRPVQSFVGLFHQYGRVAAFGVGGVHGRAPEANREVGTHR